MPGGVQIRDIHVGFGGEIADDVFIGPDHCSHGSLGRVAGFLHKTRALSHEGKAGFEVKGPRCGMSCELTQGQAGCGMDRKIAQFLAQCRQAGKPVNIERGLAVNRLGQFLFRSFKRDPAQGIAQNGVSALKKIGHGGVFGGEILAHADRLCALAGEKKCDAFAHSMCVFLDFGPHGG